MRSLYLTFEDKDFIVLKALKDKSKLSWVKFLLKRLVKNENKRMQKMQ